MTQVQIWDAVNLLVNEAGRLKGIKLEPPAKPGTQRMGDWTFKEEIYGDDEVTVEIARWSDYFTWESEKIALPYSVLFDPERKERDHFVGLITEIIQRIINQTGE